MKTLLLSLTLTLASLSAIAQFTDTYFSIESMSQPTGTIYFSGNSTDTILATVEVTVKNNNTGAFFTGDQISFSMKLDGDSIPQTHGGEWYHHFTSNFQPADTITVGTNEWFVQTTTGSHELCVELYFAMSVSPPPHPYTNVDPKKEICNTFIFDFSLNTEKIAALPQISNISISSGVMTVLVKNSSSKTTIQIINTVGQIVKTENAQSNGQNFYSNINVADISTGVYIVNIRTEDGISLSKKVFIP